MEFSDTCAGIGGKSDISLLKEVSYGNVEAFDEIMNRYMGLVSRTSFRILCDRVDSEYVTVKVFVSLWHDVLEYDDRFTLEDWLLRKTCLFSRIRIVRRRFRRVAGIYNDVFVRASPKVEDQDDYLTKQAWELYCRATTHMTPLQSAVYAMCVLDEISQESVAFITGLTRFRIGVAQRRAEEKIMDELRMFGKEKEYDRYNGFLRKVAESLTDKDKLRNEILVRI